MCWLPHLEVYGKFPVMSIYALYFDVNLTIIYAEPCDLTLGASESGNKSSSLSSSFIRIFGDWNFVYCNLWSSWLMQPFVVAMILERCLVTNFRVNPGHVVNWIFFMDLMKVEFTGLKPAACLYKTRSVFVSFFRIITESECSDIGCNTVKSWSLLVFGTIYLFCTSSAISHKPSVKFLFPCKVKYSYFIT